MSHNSPDERIDASAGGGLNNAAVQAAGAPGTEDTGEQNLPGTDDLGAAADKTPARAWARHAATAARTHTARSPASAGPAAPARAPATSKARQEAAPEPARPVY